MYYRRREYKSWDIGNVEITKLELLTSVIIVLVMMSVGFVISTHMKNKAMEKAENYNTAVEIDTKDYFDYALNTNVGNIIVNGDMKSVDTVSYKELQNQYMYITKVTEKYTRHVHHTKVGKSSVTYYTYSWDRRDSDTKVSKDVTFLGNSYSSSIFDLSSNAKVLQLNKEIVSESISSKIKGKYYYKRSKNSSNVGDLRYYYKVIPIDINASFVANVENNTINPLLEKKITVYKDKDTQEVLKIKVKQSENSNVIFWCVWIGVTVVMVVGFIALDNNWSRSE